MQMLSDGDKDEYFTVDSSQYDDVSFEAILSGSSMSTSLINSASSSLKEAEESLMYVDGCCCCDSSDDSGEFTCHCYR